MTEDEVNQVAKRVVTVLLGVRPKYSQIVPFVRDYTGDGESLDNAVAIMLEVEELWDKVNDLWVESE